METLIRLELKTSWQKLMTYLSMHESCSTNKDKIPGRLSMGTEDT